MSRARRWLGGLAGFLPPSAFGVAWLVWIGGGQVLRPTNIDWTIAGDWAAHMSGWLFYRQEPWGFPLAHVTRLFYPGGMSIGYTDSIPWLAVLMKPFAAVLPEDFQYLGPWLGLCFAGLGAAGALLARACTPRPWLQALSGMLFALTPTLLSRVVHPALCGHALIVVLLWLNARAYPTAASARRGVLLAGGLLVLASGIHPYLAVMVLALAVALLVRLAWVDRHLSRAGALGWAVALTAANLATYWVLGYLGQGVSKMSGGFGVYSSDLLALVDPQQFSRWLPALGHHEGQNEGIGYLGMGVLLANLLAAGTALARPRRARELPWTRVAPLAVACLLFALYSLSGEVTFAGKPVLDVSVLYRPFNAVVGAFRASGRFIWPLHYLLLAGPVLLLLKLWEDRPRVAGAALLGCVALQATELDPAWDRLVFTPAHLARPEATAWSLSAPGYQHLALFPAELTGTACSSPTGYKGAVLARLTYLAYRRHLTFNSGFAARSSAAQVKQCLADMEAVGKGRLDAETLYIVAPELRGQLEGFGATCGTLDGFVTCARPAAPDAFTEALRRSP